MKGMRLPHQPVPQKKFKKIDVIILVLPVYFYLYIFYCKLDQGSEASNTKQISQFFIMPGG